LPSVPPPPPPAAADGAGDAGVRSRVAPGVDGIGDMLPSDMFAMLESSTESSCARNRSSGRACLCWLVGLGSKQQAQHARNAAVFFRAPFGCCVLFSALSQRSLISFASLHSLPRRNIQTRRGYMYI
jgi:hypothetical protein